MIHHHDETISFHRLRKEEEETNRMYENATALEFQSGKMDEALRILKEKVVPVLKDQAGLISLCLLPNRTTNKIVVISLWDSKAHASAAEAVSAYQRQMKKLEPLLTQQSVYPEEETRAQNRVRKQIALN
jgi:quinol monooxygenase YgiN